MQETPALVTVGIPVYNGERWLPDAVDSILNQTFDRLVLAISDNASTDGTQEICESYAAIDERVQFSRTSSNVGLFANYDRVFAMSSTPYFKWASCNDICGPSFLESCINVLEERPDVVLAYPRTALFDKNIEAAEPWEDDPCIDQQLASERIRALLSTLRLNNAFNGVIRSDILRRTRLNKIHTGSDINLVAELALHGKIIRVSDRQFYRRMNATASSILVPEKGRSAYFSNEPRDVLELRQFRIEGGLIAALLRTPMPVRERIATARYLTRRLIHNRDKLFGELGSVIRARLYSFRPERSRR